MATILLGRVLGGNRMPIMLGGQPSEACRVWACRFQKCMRETRFDMDRCQWEVEALKKCCEERNANGKSLHCAFAPSNGSSSVPETDKDEEEKILE